MLEVGTKVTVTAGKFEGSKGVIVHAEGEKVWVTLDTPQGKVENLQLYQSTVKANK